VRSLSLAAGAKMVIRTVSRQDDKQIDGQSLAGAATQQQGATTLQETAYAQHITVQHNHVRRKVCSIQDRLV
jgi:hypothetical protein